MSDSDHSAPPSAGSGATPPTSFDGLPGIIFAGCHIQNPKITEEGLEEWHREHFNDLLTCPGNGGLCLRYHNLDPSYSFYDDPKLYERPGKSAEVTREGIRRFNWKRLSLVKVNDLSWIVSPQFLSLPYDSKVLPPKEDGSWGNAWDAWWAAVRTYQKINRKDKEASEKGRPKYIVSIQFDPFDEESVNIVEGMHSNDPTWRSTTNYKLARGLLVHEEVGNLPEGYTVFEFDEKPEPPADLKHSSVDIVRYDAWELFLERGDSNLEL